MRPRDARVSWITRPGAPCGFSGSLSPTPSRPRRLIRHPHPSPFPSQWTRPRRSVRASPNTTADRVRARARAGLLAASVLAAVLSASAILGAPSALGSVAARLGASKDYFPFVAYLSAGDPDAEELFRSDWDEHHAGGRVGVRVVPRPRPGVASFAISPIASTRARRRRRGRRRARRPTPPRLPRRARAESPGVDRRGRGRLHLRPR